MTRWQMWAVRYAKVGEPWAFKVFDDKALAERFAQEHRAKKGWVAEVWDL